MLVTTLCAPLVDYMPGVRAGVVWDLPRAGWHRRNSGSLARQLRARGYGTAFVMPRTWKSAIAPALAGIPERVGFVGEARFGLLNRWRWGERALPRMIDRKASLALPAGAARPPEWPAPQLRISTEDVTRWRQAQGLGAGRRWHWRRGRSAPVKRWTSYAEAARMLAERGIDLWVIGGPNEKAMAAEIGQPGPAGPGSDGPRPAKRHSGDGGGHHRNFERLRFAARRGCDRNAHNGNFRTDQPLSLGALERARRDNSGENASPVPTMPSSGLHQE